MEHASKGEPDMTDTSTELDGIMRDLGLDCADVARELNVPIETVRDWASADDNDRPRMPETELRLLRYSLMTENRRYFLF